MLPGYQCEFAPKANNSGHSTRQTPALMAKSLNPKIRKGFGASVQGSHHVVCCRISNVARRVSAKRVLRCVRLCPHSFGHGFPAILFLSPSHPPGQNQESNTVKVCENGSKPYSILSIPQTMGPSTTRFRVWVFWLSGVGGFVVERTVAL